MGRQPVQRINPSRRERQTPTPQVSLTDFGAGVGQALGGASQSLAGLSRSQDLIAAGNLQIEEAKKARQGRIDTSNAKVDFLRLQNDFTLEQIDLAAEAPEGMPGFEEQTLERARARGDEFLASLPPDLQTQFAPSVEEFVQKQRTSAFTTQLSAENVKYHKDVLEVTNAGLNSLLDTRNPVQNIDGIEAQLFTQLDDLLESSPLTTAENAALREDIVDRVKRTKLARLAQEEQLDNMAGGGTVAGRLQTSGGVVRSDGPVAAGLSPTATGFLQALSGPESNGEYNVLFSPRGRRHFSDFSQHPNDPAIIESGPNAGRTSSAAGRYQFLKSTWDTVAAQYGFEDFSPENQDRAAWLHANDVYASLTGKNLAVVLQSGNFAAIAEARRLLTGTWEGLGNVSDEEFYNQVISGTGNPSSLIYDEEFASIPLPDRMDIFTSAIMSADNLRAQLASQQEEQKNQTLEQLRRSIDEGDPNVNLNTIGEIAGDVGATFKEEQALIKQFEDKHAEQLAGAAMLEALGNPATLIDPGSEDTTDGLNALYNGLNIRERLATGDAETVSNIIVPSVVRSGTITKALSNELLNIANSVNPQQAEFGLETLARLSLEAPGAFEARFDGDTVSKVAAFRTLQGTMPAGELIALLNAANDPANAGLIDANNKAFNSLIADGEISVSQAGIIRDVFGRGITVDTTQGAAFTAEYNTLLRQQFRISGDIGKARTATEEILNRRWSTIEINGREQLMRFAPNLTHPQFQGTHDYVMEQFNQEAADIPDNPAYFISDEVTAQEFQEGRLPSYMMIRDDAFGNPIPMKFRETKQFDAMVSALGLTGIDLQRFEENMAGLPARFFPEITQTMNTAEINRAAAINELRGEADTLRDEIKEMSRDPFLGIPFSAEDRERTEAIQVRLAELDQEEAILRGDITLEEVPEDEAVRDLQSDRTTSGIVPLPIEVTNNIIRDPFSSEAKRNAFSDRLNGLTEPDTDVQFLSKQDQIVQVLANSVSSFDSSFGIKFATEANNASTEEELRNVMKNVIRGLNNPRGNPAQRRVLMQLLDLIGE